MADSIEATHRADSPFRAHIELLRRLLAHRAVIADRIEAVLNTLRKPVRYRSLLSDDFEGCFAVMGCAHPVQIRSQLEEAHWVSGFRPRPVQHLYNDLIDPVEMMLRAAHGWQQTRWPGHSNRVHFAHTLFNLYVLRWLQFLSLQLGNRMNAGGGPGNAVPDPAGSELGEIQSVLDQVWSQSPPGQPAFVRDARWLIPLALSLITDELAPYFEITRWVADALPESDVLEVQRAYVHMLGGHLTSQIRHYSLRDRVPISDLSVVLRTRTSNALDLALLVQGLVAVLRAYDRAIQEGDAGMRRRMAGAVCQGISPDPELFLNRVDLLNAYCMIEHVFIATDHEGNTSYSSSGRRHMELFQEYRSLLARLMPALRDDAPHFRPVPGGCSPYGVVFGLPSTLIEHMALKAAQQDAETRFSLEDVFSEAAGNGQLGSGDRSSQETGAAKLAWVKGWRNLPHISREMQHLFDYPQQFAEEIHGRIQQELRRQGEASAGSRTGRLYLDPAGGDPGSELSAMPRRSARYFLSSDRQFAVRHGAEYCERAQLLASRREGHFLVSFEIAGSDARSEWVALKKELLTEVLGAGEDATIAGLPPAAHRVLQLMCPDLIAADNTGRGAGPLS